MPEREPQATKEHYASGSTRRLSLIEKVRLTSTLSSLRGKRYLSDKETKKYVQKLTTYGEYAIDQLTELLESEYDNYAGRGVALKAALAIDREKTARKLLKLMEEKSGRLPHNAFEIVSQTLLPDEVVPVLNNYLALRYSTDKKKPEDGGATYDFSVQCAEALATIGDPSSIQPLKTCILDKRYGAAAYLSNLAKIDGQAACQTVAEFIEQECQEPYWYLNHELPIEFLGYPIYQYLIDRYQNQKGDNPELDKIYQHYITRLIPRFRNSHTGTEYMDLEDVINFISSDPRLFELFTGQRKISEIPNDKRQELEEEIYRSKNWGLARGVGLSPAREVVGINRTDPDNYTFRYNFQWFVEDILKSEFAKEPRETLEELLEISIAKNTPELTFRLIEAGLPLLSNLENFADKIDLDKSYPTALEHGSSASHLNYFVESQPTDFNNLPEDVEQKLIRIMAIYGSERSLTMALSLVKPTIESVCQIDDFANGQDNQEWRFKFDHGIQQVLNSFSLNNEPMLENHERERLKTMAYYHGDIDWLLKLGEKPADIIYRIFYGPKNRAIEHGYSGHEINIDSRLKNYLIRLIRTNQIEQIDDGRIPYVIFGLKGRSFKNIEEPFAEYLYTHPNEDFLNGLASGLIATIPVYETVGGTWDPEWGLQGQESVYSHDEPDRETRKLAENHLRKITWLTKEQLQSFIDNPEFKEARGKLKSIHRKIKR